MAISIASVKKAEPSKFPIALIYGVPGVGKTSLAAEAPNPIFIQIGGEGMPVGLEVDTFGDEVKTFDDVLAAIGSLYTEEHEFKTLIVDSLEALETLIFAEVCKRLGISNIEDAGFGKGYVKSVDIWNEFLGGLLALRKDRKMNIVLLGHTEIGRFDSPTSDPYSRYMLALDKRARPVIEAACDAILFVNYRVSLKKVDVGFNKTATHGEGGGARVIYTEERPGFVAKNRYGMPPELNYKKGEGWSVIAKHFPAAE